MNPFFALCIFIFSFANVLLSQTNNNWPDWRGPNHNGVTSATGLPDTWGETENLVWKTAIHDQGWSTPVI